MDNCFFPAAQETRHTARINTSASSSPTSHVHLQSSPTVHHLAPAPLPSGLTTYLLTPSSPSALVSELVPVAAARSRSCACRAVCCLCDLYRLCGIYAITSPHLTSCHLILPLITSSIPSDLSAQTRRRQCRRGGMKWAMCERFVVLAAGVAGTPRCGSGGLGAGVVGLGERQSR